MSAYLSKNLQFSLMEGEDAMVTAGKKQGIVSILGSDSERTKAASLRRTLSADMSSKKWLEQNGMPTMMKRVASVLEFPVSSTTDSSSCFSSDEEEEERKGVQTHGSQLDIWTSIISQKAGEDSSKSEQLPPYIHPLVKRASSLSEKSLEICTESLGSETGSDGFSSYPSSETGDEEEVKEEEEEEKQEVEQHEEKVVVTEEFRVAKYSCSYNKKSSSPRSFPPPLPSLSRGDGPSLRMQSHRENGRLVLEAVSIPSQKNFSAQRQDGRLLLTFVSNSTVDHEPKDKEIGVNDENDIKEAFDELLGEFDEEEKVEVVEEEEVENGVEENIAKKMGIVMMEQAPKMRSEVMNVNRTALMMNKLIRLANRNPTWPKRINEVVKFEDVEEEDEVMELQPQSFPPPPHGRVARRLIPTSPTSVRANATFNTYDNFWRSKPTTASVIFTPSKLHKSASFKNNNINNNNNNNNNMVLFSKSGTPKANDNKQQQMLVMRGDNGDYLVPMMRNCKESRRSLLFWEPFCIATS